MSKRNPTMFPDREHEAQSIEKAQSLPSGKERTDALREAGRLQNAAVAYRQIFNDEGGSRENG